MSANEPMSLSDWGITGSRPAQRRTRIEKMNYLVETETKKVNYREGLDREYSEKT
jgi:hypothetical protein